MLADSTMSLGTYPDHEHDPWGEPRWPGVADEYGRHTIRATGQLNVVAAGLGVYR